MNPYGHMYGQSEPYYPQQYDMQAPNAYSFPGTSDTDNVGMGLQMHKDYTQSGFPNGHNVIPGLGMSLSKGGSEMSHGPLPTGSGRLTTTVQLPNKQIPLLDPESARQTTVQNVEQTNEAMEEGEVSEGELEDIYDPEALDENTHGAPTSSNVTLQNVETRRQRFPQDNEALERSGSYSPYLSPREINLTKPAGLQGQQGNQTDLQTSTESFSSNPEAASTPTETSWEEARKHAQDTILRLWPLKIRYQDYLNEGLDEATLRGLFTDLGLGMKDSSTNEATPADFQATESGSPPNSDLMDSSSTKPGVAELEKAQPIDPSKEPKRSRGEERKDRIARLLAAKQASAPQLAEKPEMTSTAKPVEKPVSSSGKTQAQITAEKSRLLQLKMEALRKAREAQAQAQAAGRQQTTENPHSNLAPSSLAIRRPPTETLATDHQKENDGDTSPPSSIPGLFLPSGQTASSNVQQKRPMASELNDLSDLSSKRPFGQPRQSQPFLIDVSDDEDDAAMDIDSPELDASSVHRSNSPFKVPSFPMLPSSSTPRENLSPGLAQTPPGNSRSTVGGGNLESMNKEIELMKRRIAEAEARRRAKVPKIGSAPGHNGQDDINTESSDPISKSGLVSSVEGSELAREESPPTGSLGMISQKLPKNSDLKQSDGRTALHQRSRVASERLPLVEAYRQEQLRKLEALRSQMVEIEKGIAASLEEEKQLRDEVSLCNAEAEKDPAPTPIVQEATSIEVINPPINSSRSLQLERQIATMETEQRNPANETENNTPGEAINTESFDDENNTDMPDIESREDTDDDSDDRMDEDSSSSEVGNEREVHDDLPDAQNPTEQEAQGSGTGHESDAYEPEDSDQPASAPHLDKSPSFSPEPAGDSSHETSDNEQQAIVPTPLANAISTGQVESTAASPREEHHTEESGSRPGSSFVPYTSSLRSFRAYRFHPQFNNSVPGGFRSLTYSNNIDANWEVCPDQLAGQACSRGNQCPFQHFEAMPLADDQILLQLGSHSSFEGEQKNQFISGLRQLLTDYRERKIKDFQTISKGIVEYRTNFCGDKSKILPLGNVSL